MSRKDAGLSSLRRAPGWARPTDIAKVKARIQCPGCKEVLQQDDLHESLQTCPHCRHHLKIGGMERLLR